MKSIWIGHDPREVEALAVAAQSIGKHINRGWDLSVVDLKTLQARGLYQRPTEVRDGKLFDVISDAPMSTEFALTRFLVPFCATFGERAGAEWALFVDCDVMFRADPAELFALGDPSKAVMVVKHDQRGGGLKMDGQAQTSYPRKNWSSVVLWNLKHPANQALTVAKINTWKGRSLHAFKWLDDAFIGELPAEWNHLVGVNDPNPDAKLVHFTLGIPTMPGYEDCEFADEWKTLLAEVAPRQ